MQKDGTYRVVYGTELDKITGSVKLSVVGYGRKTQEGGDTLGGRSASHRVRFGLGLGGRGWLIGAWFFGILLLVC
jgi:hypothetical protein